MYSIAKKILTELNKCEKTNTVFNAFGIHEKSEEVKQALKEFKQLQAENKRLREALGVIAEPAMEGWVFTSQKAKDEAHSEKLLAWLNNRTIPSHTIIGGTLLSLIVDVAEQALQEEKT